ncbi:hypothetical protein [uncultured Dokdonia sp.]|uniref:hypothetical protein n=1 Tax=uncultured Dokdonia sp. TaxID=575653 RepID=UPI0026327BFC|nr:hypothetical protein [uncultured Dokdonia sp.]
MKIYNKFQTLILIAILGLSFFLFTACSSDDNNSNAPINFEPVTIDLTQVDIDVDDTAFTVQGFNFDVFRAQGTEQSGLAPGILIAFPQNGNPSSIELDLSNVEGLSRITARIARNASTPITFFNGNTVVGEIMAVNEIDDLFEDNVYEINGQTVTAVRISSFESIVQSITLE